MLKHLSNCTFDRHQDFMCVCMACKDLDVKLTVNYNHDAILYGVFIKSILSL